jgi:hypothetical protein
VGIDLIGAKAAAQTAEGDQGTDGILVGKPKIVPADGIHGGNLGVDVKLGNFLRGKPAEIGKKGLSHVVGSAEYIVADDQYPHRIPSVDNRL